jgi:two-component system, response regulator
VSEQAFLAVEDDPNDTIFLQRAFRKLGFGDILRVLVDGQEARDYLSGLGKYANPITYPVPDVIILDLKLPRVNGFEFLSWLRADTRLASTPVVVLTSSSDPGDIERARSLGVLSYYVKPGGFDKLLECAKEIAFLRQELRMRKPVTGRFP